MEVVGRFCDVAVAATACSNKLVSGKPSGVVSNSECAPNLMVIYGDQRERETMRNHWIFVGAIFWHLPGRKKWTYILNGNIQSVFPHGTFTNQVFTLWISLIRAFDEHHTVLGGTTPLDNWVAAPYSGVG